MREIRSFRVMDILGRAKALESRGSEVIHMEVGEPDFPAPTAVVEAAGRALGQGRTHYTPAAGLPVLREAIAGYYRDRFQVDIDPRRVLVTPGSSGALQLVLSVLVDPGDEVVVADPGYPCNRHMVSQLGGRVRTLDLWPGDGFRVRPADVMAAVDAGSRLVMLASPANPTGQVFTPDEMAEIVSAVQSGGDTYLLVDEIYQGLQYDIESFTACEFAFERLFVINSFSKYFGMTGFRVGWMVVPEVYVEPLERLAQNLYLAPPTIGQYGALAALKADVLAELDARRDLFRGRRDVLRAGLERLGFTVPGESDGAFYLYARLPQSVGVNAVDFCQALLEQALVAITPGADFSRSPEADHWVRFAYTTDEDRLNEGLRRIGDFLA